MTEVKAEYKIASKNTRKPWRCPGCGEPIGDVNDNKLHITTEEFTIIATGQIKVIHNTCGYSRDWHISEEQIIRLLDSVVRGHNGYNRLEKLLEEVKRNK